MENGQTPDPYDAVIADLKAQRDKIDQAILLLGTIRGIGIPIEDGMAAVGVVGAATKSHGPVPTLGPGAFLGMSIVDATKKLLASERRQIGTTEITREIERGGVALTSADKVNTVGSILLRRFYSHGDIVRVSRGVWGLGEWYPGRKFQKSGAPKAGNSKGEEDEAPEEPPADEAAPEATDATRNPSNMQED